MNKNTILLTGATGFLGKVVLEELLRRKHELEISHVFVLIRPQKNQTPQQRFHSEVQNSDCFSKLPVNWSEAVQVFSAELTQNGCLLSAEDVKTICSTTTHVIHCAASISFDLPLQQAAAANITSALNVSELATLCKNLKSFVSVSTAYVTPPGQVDKINEALVPLKRSAAGIYGKILSGDFNERQLLAETGHANTYTFTKCVAEHLLMESAEPKLKIVRPSIISASWQYPFAGWIDSPAAFAGFVTLIGSGYFKVLNSNPKAWLDIVPVDEVSQQIVAACFEPGLQKSIRHTVRGIKNSSTVEQCFDAIVKSFSKYPFAKPPQKVFVGGKGLKFKWLEWQHHHAPLQAATLLSAAFRNVKLKRKSKRLASQLNFLNSGFSSFVHNTFDFQQQRPLKLKNFNPSQYLAVVCAGVAKHLLNSDPTQTKLMGQHKKEFNSDALWALTQPKGNVVIRSFGYTLKKATRLCFDEVTFDAPSFHKAKKAVGDEPVIYVSTHRSYFDFLVWPFLFFSHPELGFRLPFIAAAKEFSELAILGKVFEFCNAFYVSRGKGKEDAELSEKIRTYARESKPILFFIEGTRSRFGNFLEPKRGLLRAFQNSGQSFKIVPLSISYDRRPEEAALLREMLGAKKQKMKISSLLKWSLELISKKFRMGRIHLKCGTPISLTSSSDIPQLSNRIMAELMQNSVTTDFQLSQFTSANAALLTPADLKVAIENRGGRVLASVTTEKQTLHPYLVAATVYNWKHLFYPDAVFYFFDNPAIQHHILQNSFQQKFSAPRSFTEEPFLNVLLTALFKPVCDGYGAVALKIKSFENSGQFSLSELTAGRDAENSLYGPYVSEVLKDLKLRKIILESEAHKDIYQWGAQRSQLNSYIENVKFRISATPQLFKARKNSRLKSNLQQQL